MSQSVSMETVSPESKPPCFARTAVKTVSSVRILLTIHESINIYNIYFFFVLILSFLSILHTLQEDQPDGSLALEEKD